MDFLKQNKISLIKSCDKIRSCSQLSQSVVKIHVWKILIQLRSDMIIKRAIKVVSSMFLYVVK